MVGLGIGSSLISSVAVRGRKVVTLLWTLPNVAGSSLEECVRRGHLPILLGSLWACCLGAGAARAEQSAKQKPLEDAIEVVRGATCLQRERVVGHVRMWLGRAQVDPALRVIVRGDAANARALSFDIVRGREQRHRAFDVAPESCDDLHAVVGLAIALAIDAEALAGLAAPASKVVPALRRIAIALAAANELLPNFSFGADVGIELGVLSWLSARLDAFGQFSLDDTISGSRGRFDAVLAAGSLQVCAGGRPDPEVRLALCVGPAAGAVYAAGRGYTPNRAATGLWLGVRSGARLEARLGLLWVLDIDVLSAITTPSFEADRGAGMVLLRPPSTTGFMLGLGPAFAF